MAPPSIGPCSVFEKGKSQLRDTHREESRGNETLISSGVVHRREIIIYDPSCSVLTINTKGVDKSMGIH